MTWSHSRAILFLIGITALAYLNTLGNDFVWDDEMLVVNNPAIRNWTYVKTVFTADLFRGNPGWVATHYRPLQTLTYTWDYMWWGLNPAGYHITNTLFHLACVLLVYALGWRVLGRIGPALAAAAVFAVHPVNTNGITYIAGRADSMAFAGMLAALVCLDRHRRAESVGWFVGAMVSYAAALFSRENAMLLPLLVVLYCRVVQPDPKHPWRAAVLTALPFVVMAIAFGLLRKEAIAIDGRPTAIEWGVPAALRIQGFFRALASYGGLLVWPARLQMERQVLFGSPAYLHTLTVVGILLVPALVGSLWWGYRRKPVVFLGIAWFVVTLVPLLGVLKLNATLAEHWVYVPSAGLYIALAAVAMDSRLNTRAGHIVLAAVVAAFTARTIVRNRDWSTADTFYTATAKAAPYSAAARLNLNRVLAQQSETNAAITELQTAAQLDPTSPSVLMRLATTHRDRNDLARARAAIEEAIRLSPQHLAAKLIAADIYHRLGDAKAAERLFEIAVAMTVTPEPRMRYANFLLEQNRHKAALTVVRAGIELERGEPSLHNQLGILLATTGDLTGAEQSFRTAASLDRHAPEAWINLSRLATQRGQPSPALDTMREAYRRAPNHVGVLYQLARLEYQAGQRESAQTRLHDAQELAPGNAAITAALNALQKNHPWPATAPSLDANR